MSKLTLSSVARITTPLAMVVFMAHEITQSVVVGGWWSHAVLLGALGTAVGVEIVGIKSGQALEAFSRAGDTARTWVAGLLLATYVIAAMFILWPNLSLLPIPVIAGVIYIVSALTDGLDQATENSTAERLDQTEWQRKLQLADMKLKHELKLERIKSKPVPARASTSASTAKAEPAVKTHLCQQCERQFATVQALNAHKRFCANKVQLNGAKQ